MAAFTCMKHFRRVRTRTVLAVAALVLQASFVGVALAEVVASLSQGSSQLRQRRSASTPRR